LTKKLTILGQGTTRSSHAFARLLPSSCFCTPYFLRRMALMLMNPAIQLSECYADDEKRTQSCILGNLLASTGLKSTRLSMDDSSSEYSFSVSDDRPKIQVLPRYRRRRTYNKLLLNYFEVPDLFYLLYVFYGSHCCERWNTSKFSLQKFCPSSDLPPWSPGE
jgi:hypothetical protein